MMQGREDFLILVTLIVVYGLLLLLGGLIAVYLAIREERKHQLDLLDRFLARSYSEYGMTKMIGKEVEIDQSQDTKDDEDIDAAAMEHYQAQLARMEEELAGGKR